MSAQIKLLFAKLDALVEALSTVSAEIAEMKRVVNQAAANSELFVQGYHEHGAEIAQLRSRMEKVSLNCPLLRSKTDEFAKVGGE